MGIDVAEGADMIDERYKNTRKDNAVIVIVDMTNEEEVAKWSSKLAPNVTADKAFLYASWYENPLMVPEMNSMGAVSSSHSLAFGAAGNASTNERPSVPLRALPDSNCHRNEPIA